MRLTDYAFAVGWDCICDEPRDRTVVVRDGVPVGAPAGVREVATVERLFALVERAIHERAHVLRVRYDGRTGLPRVIVTEPAEVRSTDVTVTGADTVPMPLRAGALRRLPDR